MRQYTDGAGRVHVRVQVELMPAEAEAMAALADFVERPSEAKTLAALADDFERVFGNHTLNGLRRVRAAYRIERSEGDAR